MPNNLETYEKITLDCLDFKGVSILKQTLANINGVETRIGSSIRNAFYNNEEGRNQLKDFIDENSSYYNAIMLIWNENSENEEETYNFISNSEKINSLNNDITDTQLAIAEIYEKNEQNEEDMMLALAELYENSLVE